MARGLERLLTANAARGRRERVTLLRVFEDLRGLGYEGGYDAVRRYAAAWRREGSTGTAAAFVPLSFDPLRRQMPLSAAYPAGKVALSASAM